MLNRKTIRSHLPCPDQTGCGSSNAYTEFEDGGYCFSCTNTFPYPSMRDNGQSSLIGLERKPVQRANKLTNVTIQTVPYRNKDRKTLELLGIHQLVSTETGNLVGTVYPGPKGSRKVRDLVEKSFYWEDYKGPGLMFLDLFPSGGKAITITEGEEDAAAVYQMFGCNYPVVSVQSSGQAVKDVAADIDKLLSYERIYLCFDNDVQGKKAAEAVSAMLPFNKVYIVNLDLYKDPDEYLANGKANEFVKTWWASKRHDPENVISSFSDVFELFKQPKKRSVCSLPFPELDTSLYGIRTGETIVVKAPEGIGKTEFLGAIEYHVCKETDLNIGIFHLEEDAQRSAFRLVGYEVEQPVHIEGFADLTPDQLIQKYKDVVKTDNRVNFYQPGKNDSDVDAFLNTIRFMVASAGCRIVFFDHISRVATMFGLDTAGLDKFATQLSRMAIELDFALIMISHVNDDGQTRGSRNISKEAWTVVSLARDLTHMDPVERNTTRMLIEKNRHASITGPAGCIYFDPDTFKLSSTPPVQIAPVR